MPATRKSAKAAIVRCAHGWKTSAAISSQIVVCDGPDAFKKKFKANFACKYVKTTPAPKTTKPKKPCKKTCQDQSCDYWGSEESYTCSQLEKEYGCDCSGCDCKVDKELLCKQNKCLGKTCDEWVLTQKISCAVLETNHKCSCKGCQC